MDGLSIANCKSSLACNTCSTQDDDATFCYPMWEWDRRNEKPVMDNIRKPLVATTCNFKSNNMFNHWEKSTLHAFQNDI